MTVSESRTALVRHANSGAPRHVEARWEVADDGLMAAPPTLRFYVDHQPTTVSLATAVELRYVANEFGDAVLLPALRVIRQKLIKDASIVVDDLTLKRLLSID